MQQIVKLNGKLYELKPLKANSGKTKRKTAKGKFNAKSGYWKDFKVSQELKHTCSNGKTYPAVKGTTKDGKEMLLVGTRNGNVWSKAF